MGCVRFLFGHFERGRFAGLRFLPLRKSPHQKESRFRLAQKAAFITTKSGNAGKPDFRAVALSAFCTEAARLRARAYVEALLLLVPPLSAEFQFRGRKGQSLPIGQDHTSYGWTKSTSHQGVAQK